MVRAPRRRLIEFCKLSKAKKWLAPLSRFQYDHIWRMHAYEHACLKPRQVCMLPPSHTELHCASDRWLRRGEALGGMGSRP